MRVLIGQIRTRIYCRK